MDLYIEIGEIKREQEKILSLLNDLKKGNSKPNIYDLVDLKEILKVSKRTIATWLQQGVLPHTRVGAKIWLTEELHDFKRAKRHGKWVYLLKRSSDKNLANLRLVS